MNTKPFKEPLVVFWFRRDLRLNDNTGLVAALQSGYKVLPLFIFDKIILEHLPENDARVTFIYEQLSNISEKLQSYKSDILIEYGKPEEVWKKITTEYSVKAVFCNHDYEPYAINRDQKIRELMNSEKIGFHSFKDHVFFEKDEIQKADGTPYTVYTAYKNKWLEKFRSLPKYVSEKMEDLSTNFINVRYKKFQLSDIGFEKSKIAIPALNTSLVKDYDKHRDIPEAEKTTLAGHHLRFGTISIRSLVYFADSKNQVFLSELIWRDFFSQILYHFPHVVTESFKKKYDFIEWENDPELFEKWCKGETGYPIVDAGMKQLNQTGFMHNRVRMIVASFLVKHLLIDWRWGEAYFAEKLLDYDLASNNGNWQWAAGCGCDAAPYFRVFNPIIQQEKFDPDFNYVRKWIPGFDPENYITPIVDYKFARERIIQRFKKALA